MTQPSGSQLKRALACPASLHLPQVTLPPSEAAGRGTWIHRYLELLYTGHSQADALKVLSEGCPPEIVDECQSIVLPSLPTVQWECEKAIAYDISDRTARWLGNSIGRNYGELGTFEVPLTLDMTAVTADCVYVLDWKTGHAELGPPREHPQLLAGALAMAKLHDRHHARVAFGYVRQNGEIHVTEWAELDIFDLEDFGETLRDLQMRSASVAATIAQGKTPDVTMGGHCDYCPAFHSCPGQTSLVRSIPGLAKNDSGSLTRGQMGEAWVKIRSARKLLSQMERTIRAEAAREPIPLPNGKTLGPVMVEGNEKLDGRVAHSVIADVTEDFAVADAAVDMKVTKASIDRALKVHCQPGELASVRRKVLKQIREAGGATRPRKEGIEEY